MTTFVVSETESLARMIVGPPRGDADGFRPLRSRYYAVAKDDSYRASNPGARVPLDERRATAAAERAAVHAALKRAAKKSRAAEILSAAASELDARVEMLRNFPSAFAGAESEYRAAASAHAAAQKALNVADPAEVASIMIELERTAAAQRKAARAADAVLRTFEAARHAVLPLLQAARESCDREARLREDLARELDGRSADVEALCGALT